MASNIDGWKLLRTTEHILAAGAGAYLLYRFSQTGVRGLVRSLTDAALQLPGAEAALNSTLDKEIQKAIEDNFKPDGVKNFYALPKEGLSYEETLELMKQIKNGDLDPSKGKLWAYAYDAADGGKHKAFIAQAHNLFMDCNGLNPMAFPSLRHFENDVVSMSLKMFNAPSSGCGTMTSGGTESLLMAVKTYRDYALHHLGITEPELICATTGHPAIYKGCHYFGVKLIQVGVDSECRMDVKETQSKITRNTILIIGSAPSYPHGVIDPIEKLAELAAQLKIGFHVDACIGGFMLPWITKNGYSLPKWDFEVPGVTSISADSHKYGFASKGSSVILYRSNDIRQHQFFAWSSWPGGLFVSPSALGTRAGGSIAAAWAAMVALGENGYVEKFRVIMDTVEYIRSALQTIPGITLLGNQKRAESSLIAFTSTDFNILVAADYVEEKFGWKLEGQQNPISIHLTVMPQHFATRQDFIEHMKEGIQYAKENPNSAKGGKAGVYGMVATIPSPSIAEKFLKAFIGQVYTNTPQ